MGTMSHITLPSCTRAVIFDCDGVLIDSWNAALHFFNSMRRAVGLGPMSSEEEQACFVRTISESLDMIIPAPRRAEAEQAWKSFDMAEILDLIRPHEGIAELLGRLRGAGLLLAVSTNGGQEQHTILEHHGLRAPFHRIVTADDVERGKPWPDGPNLILEEFDLTPDQTVFVGDSAVDAETARNAGIPFWAYANPDLAAQVHIRCFADIHPA